MPPSAICESSQQYVQFVIGSRYYGEAYMPLSMRVPVPVVGAVCAFGDEIVS